MVSTDLMYTLAEVGGTFVAILAGLYTTKIISISADKTRLENKINEILIKINSKKQRLTRLQKKFKIMFVIFIQNNAVLIVDVNTPL